MNDEKIIIQFTPKGEQLAREIEKAFDEWLERSEMTKNELLQYKNVKGFHIAENENGFYLAYYENEPKQNLDKTQTKPNKNLNETQDKTKDEPSEKQIGIGIVKEQRNVALWLFGYITALLDDGNNYKSDFAKEFLKWGAKYE